ncbi:AfsA-related hotdog domain-containing protein [Kitasatospora purpeofusca]|uniref:A-factor biosynthesis hotdog domain-containing protein n=1 Tax=Kitasatospora purpeofusca TaxID=67352 RepID=A0ABZ1UAI1_9ACTN|nr:AfsA-related hotdog domain-containing protein [Kitasatospora purpeofusca]
MDRGSLIGPVRALHDSDGWLADLRVDQTDPFFFDHPLDHVPGMLLLCGMADLVVAVTDIPAAGRVRAAMTFHSMAELGPELELCVVPLEDGRRTLRTVQGSAPVADGWVEVSSADGPAWPNRLEGSAHPPAQASLVHRVRPENVMIGDPSVADGRVAAAVVFPSEDHALSGRRPGVHRTEAVVEAGRQLSTWLTHRTGGWSLDTQILLRGVTVDLPVGMPCSLPLALRWQTVPISASRTEYRFDLIAGGDLSSDDSGDSGEAPVVGSLVYTGKIMRPEVYARFRANRSTG